MKQTLHSLDDEKLKCVVKTDDDYVLQFLSYQPIFQELIPRHSLANKTVVQVQPKSTTGSSILLEYIRDFCRMYDAPPNFFPFCLSV